MIGFIYAIIALSILIVVHEFGHFIVARLVNVKVITFSLGFGKKLLKFNRGETEYAISAMPLGGYVKMLGESPTEEVSDEDKERSFSHKSPFQRFLIVFAGPFFNILFALAIIYLALLFNGYGVVPAKVGNVQQGSPAFEAGIRAGDLVTKINSTKINSWDELTNEMVFAKLQPMNFTFEREGKTFTVIITPIEKEEKNLLGGITKRKIIGIELKTKTIERRRLNIFSAIPKSFEVTYTMTKAMLRGLYHMIIGDISTKEIGGPIAILQLTGKHAEGGLWSLSFFIAFISINLGIVNLFPIPVLDGGHILFNFIEIITRKRFSEKTIEKAQMVGLTLLIMLMAFAFYNDIFRIWPQIVDFFHKIVAFFMKLLGKA